MVHSTSFNSGELKAEHLYSALHGIQTNLSAQAWITQFNLRRTPCLPIPCKPSPDSASTDWGGEHLIAAYYSFIDHERMKGWVDLVGWPSAEGLPTEVVTHQLKVERATGKVRRPRPTFLPLNHSTNQLEIVSDIDSVLNGYRSNGSCVNQTKLNQITKFI